MDVRPAAHQPRHTALSTGDFRKGSRYRVQRPEGGGNWLLFATVGGGGLFRHPAGVVPFPAGTVAAVAPGTPQDYGTDPVLGVWTFAWAHLRPEPEWLELLDWPEVQAGVRLLVPPPTAQERIVACLRAAHAVASERGMRRGRDIARSRIHEALLWCDEANPRRQRGTEEDPRLTAVRGFITTHLADPLALAGLARVAGLSLPRFAHLFRAVMGMAPMAYVEQQRLLRAGELLLDPQRKIRDVALAVGFVNPYHFSSRFRRWSGVSPRAWRKGRTTTT